MGINRRWTTVRVFFSFLIVGFIFLGLLSCQERIETLQTPQQEKVSETQLPEKLSEVAPPKVIQQLSKILQIHQPQVSIISPKPDQIREDTSVSVQFQVQDLPVFKDLELGMGPHLNVLLDNQPYQEVYNLEQPLVFEDLSPGTHTLRVFAVRPWQESFKNEGAYAQTTFHIFTKTTDNQPEPTLPLLTYNSPQGNYGAEPIMLDFYLTNAPLHLVASESTNDDIADWRIRVTANGESFILDRWQSFYLKGFKPGKNWVELEFLDELGNPVKNAFNNTVRLINYQTSGQDTLSKLMRGEISAEVAMGIVDPNYEKPEPTSPPLPVSIPSTSVKSTESTTETEDVTEEDLIEAEDLTETEIPVTEEPANLAQPSSTETEELPKGKSGNSITRFFSRFRNLTNPFGKSPEVQEELKVPSSEPKVSPSPLETPAELKPDQSTSPVEAEIEEDDQTAVVEEKKEIPQPKVSPSPLETPAELKIDQSTSPVEAEIEEDDQTAVVK